MAGFRANILRTILTIALALVIFLIADGGSVDFSGPAGAAVIEPRVPETAPVLQETGAHAPVAGGAPGNPLSGVPVYAIDSVIGTDDRVQITGTTNPPWRWIVRLEITAATGNYRCSGFFAGPRIVATAGHCLYNYQFGGNRWAGSVRVIPGKNGTSEPFGSQTVTTSWIYSVDGWVNRADSRYDYGWILLPDDSLHDKVGSFGLGVFADAGLQGLLVNLAGYPGDKPSGTLWTHSDVIVGVTANQVSYRIDTSAGQSGSPVWAFAAGVRQVVGIHTLAVGGPGCALGANCGTRITMEVLANLQAYGAYPGSSALGAVTCHVLTKNVSPAGAGSVSHAPPNSGGCATDSAVPQFATGTVVDLAATPYSGYKWVYWSGADHFFANPTTLTMSGARTVTAYFMPSSGYNCNGAPATIIGTPGDDLIIGTPGPDVIVGLGGNDRIYGMGGDDIICGNEGMDVIFGGSGNDFIDGGPDHDVCIGGTGTDMAVNCEMTHGVQQGAGASAAP